ncbi:MAG: DUF4286 family protein [Gammaproteobacteria bacterium]|nr:DUF4286 family protein [Gammaproteobacteria bacterium]MDE2345738.1 DUF4286 family protein [Gammaproteobacteria bacterium]
MAASTVIYEVTLEADAGIRDQLDAWLKTHVHDMLQLPGFLSARIQRPTLQTDSPEDKQLVRRVVRYKLASREFIEQYFQQHAARMRAETVAHFGEQLRASRRVMDRRGHDLAGIDSTATAVVPAAAVGLRCLNCGEALSGKFCANCGQQNHTHAAPLLGVINDFFGNHFGFDTKFFHSILPLLFRPGFLSREYSAGRRARYINPLRLYFFSSLVFFFMAWSFAGSQLMRINDSANGTNAKPELSQSQRHKIEDNQYLSPQQKKSILDRTQNRIQGAGSHGTSSDNDVNFNMFGRSVQMSKTELRTRMIRSFEADLPKLMFIFLPLVALLLKLFYIRSRRYYMEHLVFTLHNHAFVFIAMLVMVLTNSLAKHVAWAAAPAHYFNVIVGWYMVIYIFIAMRVYYQQSYFMTFVKYLLIGFIYWLAMLATFISGIVLIVYQVTAS